MAWRRWFLACLVLVAGELPVCFSAQAAEKARADVVVVVDTSGSMKETGMDPERTSLLVTQLLADIVPGELAAVRLLDLEDDAALLPRKETGRREPCIENPNAICEVIDEAVDWGAEARNKKLGALVRPRRGDPGFKQSLESHLEQRSDNSIFFLAFQAARGVFDEHAAAGQSLPRTVIWLSDGRAESPGRLLPVLREIADEGIRVEAIVFGKGETELIENAGLSPRRVSSPAELMKAFAGAFRRIVQAPYELDRQVATDPTFSMKPHVDEAWVVVYGEDSLGEVRLVDPAGATLNASYAQGRRAGAGAYRVAYLENPAPGTWRVEAAGGGAGTAYAVVQRSSLGPRFLGPATAISGAEVVLMAGISAGDSGEILAEPEVLAEATLTAEVEGQVLTLRDDGAEGDETAGDGRFSARTRLRGPGQVAVTVHLVTSMVDRQAAGVVAVSGRFVYGGGPVAVDLGSLGVAEEVCRPLLFTAEHEGEMPFTLRLERSLPGGHRLLVRSPVSTLSPGGEAVRLAPGTALEVCLLTSPRAFSSTARGEHWLSLLAASGAETSQVVPLELSWQVQGLTFWQRWGWLILTLLGILLLLFVIGGFVLPHRFQPGLALVFVPERGELDEQSPQPLRQWKGTRIGFYRHARAFLHPDYRVSGKPRGQLASLQAVKGGARVAPARGTALFRETLDGEWEPVPPEGRSTRGGDVYRVGERGPFFRITSRRSRA